MHGFDPFAGRPEDRRAYDRAAAAVASGLNGLRALRHLSDLEEVRRAEGSVTREATRIARLMATDPRTRTRSERVEAAGFSVSCATCRAVPFAPCVRRTGLGGAAPMHAPRAEAGEHAERAATMHGKRVKA